MWISKGDDLTNMFLILIRSSIWRIKEIVSSSQFKDNASDGPNIDFPIPVPSTYNNLRGTVLSGLDPANVRIANRLGIAEIDYLETKTR